MDIKTHKSINQFFCGEPIDIEDGKRGLLKLKTVEEMKADEKGLVHGGFIFSAADYLAMITVNHPNVVLGSANVRFAKPVKLGDEILFKSEVLSGDGRKSLVKVDGFVNDKKVFEGEFICYNLQEHVLDR